MKPQVQESKREQRLVDALRQIAWELEGDSDWTARRWAKAAEDAFQIIDYVIGRDWLNDLPHDPLSCRWAHLRGGQPCPDLYDRVLWCQPCQDGADMAEDGC